MVKIDRGCVEVQDTLENTCKAAVPESIKHNKCDTCDTELCNSASGIVYSLATISLALIVVLNVL